jgi:hypothetical protein
MSTAVDEAATYRIRVGRRVGAEWSDRLMGLTLVVDDAPDRQVATELTGPLPDQAALFGVLDLLYSLGAPLLSVERLDSGGPLELEEPEKR